MPVLRSPRRARWLFMLMICALALSTLPAQLALADVEIPQAIDNDVASFVRGSFQRTSVGLLKDTAGSPNLPDESGAVQLSPIGILKEWQDFSANPLPKPLYRMGATNIGNRIYLIGGITPTATGSESVADVLSAEVNLTTGDFVRFGNPEMAWRSEQSLPAVVGSNQSNYGLAEPVASINSAAVTSYAKSSGGGFIYVIGGNASVNTRSFSSFAVRVATVAGDGTIIGWRELTGAQIPDPDGEVGTFIQSGLQSASAVTFTTSGKTFVYLLGGLQRYWTGTGQSVRANDEGSLAVFYAQVNPGNGGLYKPSSNLGTEGWEKLEQSSIPVTCPGGRTDCGVWDSVAFADRYVITDPDNPDTDALYILGGQIAPKSPTGAPEVYSSTVYQAVITNDGNLVWSDWRGTLPEARFGHAGVTFRGNLYITGGIPNAPANNEPDQSMLTSYVEDSFELPEFATSNFLKSDVLPVRRTFHAMTLVRAGSSADSAAFVYIIGGRGDTSGADKSGSDQIAFSRIGGDEDRSYGYPPTGWFYSTVLPINFSNAEVREINWSTQITRGLNLPPMDIEVDYRISTANTCDVPGFSDQFFVPGTGANPTGWRQLDGDASSGARSLDNQNTVKIDDLPARCFQYRAKLVSGNGLEAAQETPSLLNFGIKIVIPGSPDLKVSNIEVKQGLNNPQAFGGVWTTITNRNTLEETVAASAEGGGSFFVDLLVFEPGEPVVLPSQPLTGAQLPNSRGYANVPKERLQPNVNYGIYTWCDSQQNGCVSLDWNSVITKVGRYTFIAVVDSSDCNNVDPVTGLQYVCVKETTQDANGQNVGEFNNVSVQVTYDAVADPANPSQPLPPEIQPPPENGAGSPRILLPLVVK